MFMKLIQLFLEGGIATGCPPIERKYLPQVIQLVSRVSGIPIADLHRLGSSSDTSNKPMIGDIDIAVDINKYDMNEIHQRMLGEFGDGVLTPGTKIGSYPIPINNQCVQVDLMYVKNTTWATFLYSSKQGTGPEHEPYKGSVKNVLLNAVASTMDVPGFTYFQYKDGQLTARATFVIDRNAGLKRKFGYLKQKKTGEYNKTETVITPEEFVKLFPDAKVNPQGRMLVDDPQEVAEILFGKGTTPADIGSTTNIMKLIKNKFDSERQQRIFAKANESAKSMFRDQMATMELPPEIR